MKIYQTAERETIRSIAEKHAVPERALAALAGLTPRSLVPPGVSLLLPFGARGGAPARTERQKQGDPGRYEAPRGQPCERRERTLRDGVLLRDGADGLPLCRLIDLHASPLTVSLLPLYACLHKSATARGILPQKWEVIYATTENRTGERP